MVGQASSLSGLGGMGILPVPFNRRAGSPSYWDYGQSPVLRGTPPPNPPSFRDYF